MKAYAAQLAEAAQAAAHISAVILGYVSRSDRGPKSVGQLCRDRSLLG
jgi:hypothetical protein